MGDVAAEQRQAERVRTYFDREAADYDQGFADRPRYRDPVRRLTYRWNRRAIHGRLEAVVALVGPNVARMRILEVGAGSGRYAVALARRGATVTGIDFAPGMVRLAEQLAAQAGVADRCTFRVADVFDLDPATTYDAVLAPGVIDYIPRARHEAFVRQLGRLSTGSVIISFPKQWHYHAAVRAFWLRLWKRVPVFFFTRSRIRELFAQAGLTLVQSVDVGILAVVRATHAEAARVDSSRL
jgi:2-polyprenyl-3-methyl-5-hydroxy-6-metoxy-1,4-benzoquinol methylase